MKLNEIFNESANSALTDADFTDPSVFGVKELVELIGDIYQEIDSRDAAAAAEAEAGQGEVGENCDLSFDSKDANFRLDGDEVLFYVQLYDYFRDRHDEKQETQYQIECAMHVPMQGSKIDSVALKADEDISIQVIEK